MNLGLLRNWLISVRAVTMTSFPVSVLSVGAVIRWELSCDVPVVFMMFGYGVFLLKKSHAEYKPGYVEDLMSISPGSDLSLSVRHLSEPHVAILL